MGGFFGAIVQWLLSRLFHQTPPLTQEATQAQKVGETETKLATEVQANAAQAAVAQAVTNAPKDVAGVVAELRKGEF